MSTPVELVRVMRSGFHEGSHYGAVVVTDTDGSVLHARGAVDAPVFPRSSNKPFQAVAMLQAGAQLDGADLAISAASHSGEPMHTSRVQAMLDRVSLGEGDLGCPEALPLNEAARNEVIAAGGAPRRIYMNCSGKHAGMLAACVEHGWDVATYLQTDHPLQLSVRDQVARLSDEVPSAVGIDGCGAPLFAISLLGLARAFGRVNAAARDTAEHAVSQAMREYPEMVGGTGREDTRLMRAHSGLLVKGGAEGVHCAALADGRTVAVKITDGGDRARMPVLVAGLRMLGLESDLLDELGTGVVLGGGHQVGTAELAPGVF
ncbi:L-asparaginase II [Nakamurella panacisegetis]|uniref:L-asparaginase II n=1 Tax=Nakamurella panacisegetis TaxID=1090615 RepID=A0A1H0JP85_9ACTN|nr:asparaginase [Nakamurella panacisegetis]SDO45373.1 L-asparaginase II [Nakamurella panacisegetis]